MSSLSYYYHTTKDGSGAILSHSLRNLAFRFVFGDNQVVAGQVTPRAESGSGPCFWSAKGRFSVLDLLGSKWRQSGHLVFASSPPTLPHRTRKEWGTPYCL
jgi:hypothetical protein